ncbi:hypothetical protein AOR13_1724 [Alteromonas stellipolaris LMG 21856]|nr:hypothetical protein AOR13_1724 [Alteromonas stellipolaris LMG 21856]
MTIEPNILPKDATTSKTNAEEPLSAKVVNTSSELKGNIVAARNAETNIPIYPSVIKLLTENYALFFAARFTPTCLT